MDGIDKNSHFVIGMHLVRGNIAADEFPLPFIFFSLMFSLTPFQIMSRSSLRL